MSVETATAIRLVELTRLDARLQRQVREIRNAPGVRRWMYSDHLISEAEHRDWLQRVADSPEMIVFAVLDASGELLGIVSLNAWSHRHQRADWAFYLSDAARGGLGSALEFAFLDFVFDTLGLAKLNCEVIEGNDPVVGLHRKFGFLEEGFRRSHVEKDGQRLGVHFLGLTRQDWHAARAAVREQRAKALARFKVRVEWRDADMAGS